MISKLKKLKGRSLAEIAERGRQKAVILAERAGASADLKMPSDRAFFGLFGKAKPDSASRLLKRFRERETIFYPTFRDRRATLSALRARFPGEEVSIIRRAERLIAGSFDLLGYTNLHFGTPIPDWHFDPVSGKRSRLQHWSRFDETDPSETGDKKIVWELNRHQYFTLLGRAYWLTGDETYPEVFVSHLNDWIEINPPKMGLNWISSLEIAYRSISWIWAFHFFRDSPRLRPDLFLTLLKGLYLNARHLERHLSTYSSPNTHLTGEALGLYIIGTFLREIGEAAQWKSAGYEILIKVLEYQIRDDGGYVEQATQYQRYTADIYLSLSILRNTEGLPVDDLLQRMLRKMLEFLKHVTQPNGETPLIGDDDGGRLHFLDDRGFADFRSTLAVGATVLSDGSLKFVAGEASPELLWLTGPEGLEAFDRLGPSSVDENTKAFEHSGCYVIRDGWEPESDFVLIDCGEHGFMKGGHAHADALSFVMSVRGIPVFVDSGTYTYTVDKEARDYFRSSAAHNCVSVNGASSSVPDGPFSWKSTTVSKVLEWRTDATRVLFRGTHNGYQRFGVRYEREFQFVRGTGMTLIDRIGTVSHNKFEISFILAPDVEAEVFNASRVVLREKAGRRELLTIITKVVEESAVDFDGWLLAPEKISPRYGLIIETTKLSFSLKRDHDFQIENLFAFVGRA
jgi:hypothetical protein